MTCYLNMIYTFGKCNPPILLVGPYQTVMESQFPEQNILHYYYYYYQPCNQAL